MEQHALKNVKQLFEYQHLLLPRVVDKVLIRIAYFFNTRVD